MEQTSLEALRVELRAFALEREWNQFHTPKNLSMALAVEASELLEHFQWLTPEESARPDSATRDAVSDELGDVLIYLVRIADVLNINLEAAAASKLRKNREKYPIDKAKGSARKYDKL